MEAIFFLPQGDIGREEIAFFILPQTGWREGYGPHETSQNNLSHKLPAKYIHIRREPGGVDEELRALGLRGRIRTRARASPLQLALLNASRSV